MTRDHNDVVLPWDLAEEVEHRQLPAVPPSEPAGAADDPHEVRAWQLDEVVQRVPPGEPDVA